MIWSQLKFEELFAAPLRNGVYKPKQFHGRGQKMVNMGELFAYDFLSNQEMRRIELNDTEKKNSLLRAGDLLFARRSLVLEGSGKCSLVTGTEEDTTFESSIIRARLNQAEAHPKFYFYFFGSPQGRALMASIASQTAVSGITGSNLALLKVPHPSLSIQLKIATILSAYDDLIENNTRRIQILEEMARRIYEEWFVRFRFPGHENVRMVESQLGLIPGGWSVTTLDKVATINRLSIRRGKEPTYILYVDIASVSTGKIDNVQEFSFIEAPGRARRIVRHGDIIWSNVRPNRKSFALITNPPENMIVSTGFTVISASSVPYNFLYHALTTEDFASYLTNRAKGAAYPAVGSEDFANAKVITPSPELLSTFDEIAEPMQMEKNLLLKRNVILNRTRDLLLPKLISGEIDVSNFPEPVSL